MTDRQKQWEAVEELLLIATWPLAAAVKRWPTGSDSRDAAQMKKVLSAVNFLKQTAAFLKTHIEILPDAAHVTAAEEQIAKENGQS